MDLAQRLKAARKHAQLTQKALATLAKVEQPLISQIENGTTLKSANLIKMARACGVNPLWLSENIGQMLDETTASSNVQGEPIAIRDGAVPVVGIAKLGAQGYFDAIDYPVGHGDGFVLISSSDENAYALRVVGDSMEPRIRSGEYVMIEPNKPYVSGDDVLVQIADGITVQSMIKVFMHERDGLVRLLSINDQHAPMSIERERILKIHPVGAILKPSRYVATS